MRITIQSSHDAGTEVETDQELGRALMSYTTLSFERAAEADLQTVQQQSFSHVKPTRQGRSLR